MLASQCKQRGENACDLIFRRQIHSGPQITQISADSRHRFLSE
jgi:hypothetical protein